MHALRRITLVTALVVGGALADAAAGRPARSAAPRTQIVGGSAAERSLLQAIVGRLGETDVPLIRIAPVKGGVEVKASVSSTRATWEVGVAGEAFAEQSAARHLPRVTMVISGPVGFPISNAGVAPPHGTRASAAAARDLVKRLALASGARITELSVSPPDGLAVALRMRVQDAASFLSHRLGALVHGVSVHRSRWEGAYIEVDDAHGIAWADGENRLGGDHYVRPSLSGDDPFHAPAPGPGPGGAQPA